ncbi:hypothetical protein KIN20_014893 [Parelaphostrongylus tenuis]|uniref:Uncharacterized protein n=1 Tax=Parelaphostrongylus tenuis TaxID=148309 RepID=A0AAD5QNM3_PARTN|nr:hypothetical protein KIN20_014893 [Parelaphostrongylus tenuis]
METCIIVGSTVTGICPQWRMGGGDEMHDIARLSTASTCPSQELSRLRTSSWLIGRGRCGKMLWTERFDC